MKSSLLPLILTLNSLSLASFVSGAETAPDPSWTKAADNKIYAQKLVNDALAHHPEVLVIGMHANRPGTKDERMIASNLDRIGKIDDDDDKGAAVEGKTVLAPNLKEPEKFEVLIPMQDSSGNVIGALAFVFKYHQGDDQVKLLIKATGIRNGIAKKLTSADDLFKPAE